MGLGAQMYFSIILTYMEKHGDITRPKPGPQGRMDCLQNWIELTELLNKVGDQSKSVNKWRKAFTDFKNNTKKKVRKLKNRPGASRLLTDTERRLMKLLKKQNIEKNKTNDDNEKSGINDDNEKSGTNDDNEKSGTNDVLIEEQTDVDDEGKSLSSNTQCFDSDNGPTTRRSRSRQSSFTSEASFSQHSAAKINGCSNKDVPNNLKDRLLEFEWEREKMAHDREMARIKQNNEIINTFSRMVSVLESLSPGVQKHLQSDDNKGIYTYT